VRLTSSATISSPVALGLGEICVPDAALTDLDADQQRGLLAHELAHLARRDPLWLDCASIIERVFFFQPLNRLARRELQNAAEYLCDDWAAARTGSGVPLAKCLARVAEWIQASPLGVPVAGMAEQRSLLVARIARLIGRRAAESPAPKLALAGAALVLLGAVVAAAPGVQGTPVVTGAAPQSGSAESRRPVSGEPAGAGPKVAEATGDAPHGLAPLLDRLRSSALSHTAPRLAGPSHLGGSSSEEAPVDSAVVYALIERLKDTDAGVRRAAASSLGNLRSRLAVAALIAALSDRDREVRAAAAGALGDIQDDRAIGPLTELITDPSTDVRERALDALSNFAKDVNAGPVVHALYDARADVRQKAAHLLGEIGDRAAVGPLSGLLRDANPDVRQTALQALSEIKDPSVSSAVMGALKDEYADVRHAALDALHEMKVPISERTILDMLADPSADVRQAAIQVVSDRPFPDAVPVLRRLLDDPNSDVRVEAVSALGEIGDPAARDALRSALKSKDAKVRQRAAEVLGERR
jgi:HEAT repeat protein